MVGFIISTSKELSESISEDMIVILSEHLQESYQRIFSSEVELCDCVELHFSKFLFLLFKFFHPKLYATLKQTKKHKQTTFLNIKSMHVISRS